jgi:sporulation protein YlmC with PRC-barrel domain
MIRKLMASSAIVALMSAGAMTIAQAQTDPAAPPVVENQVAPDNSTNVTPATELAASEEALTPDQPTLASAFIGRTVYSSEDPESDNIGEVNDLIVGEDGTISHALVGVGGFLGIGEKDVAVPFDELQVVERDGDIRLIYAATREQLEAAEAFDRTAYEPAARAAAEQTAATESTVPGATDPVMPAPSSDLTAAPADETTADTAAAPPADATTMPAEEQTAASEAPPVDATAPTTEDQTAATGTADSDWGADSFRTFDVSQVRASKMIGAAVNGPDDASIGEISDLVLQGDGGTRAALVDVGGFLGVGEKTVAIPFGDIQVQAESDNPDNLVLSVAMTKEQLEQLPAFEPTDRMAGAAPMTNEPANGEMAAGDPNAPAATDQMAAAPEAGIDPAAPTTIEEPAMTGSVGPMDYTRATQDLSASQLLGTTVYGPNEDAIGEIGDVVFDTNGNMDAVVLDVGGFLGMGEKPVAVGFDRLNVRTDESGALWVMIDASQEQLEQAPTYDTTATVQ